MRRGLDGLDRRYLVCIADNYGGGQVGAETIAAALADERDVVEEVIEPYLMQQGLVQRTPRGRMLTAARPMRPSRPEASGVAPVAAPTASSICWQHATEPDERSGA